MRDRKNDIQQTQGALRLMEALSGIDEELLERSGALSSPEVIAQRDESKEVTSVSEVFRRRRSSAVYRNAVAACIGFVVVGVISWNALRPIWSPKGADSFSGENASPWESVNNQSAYESAYDIDTQVEDGLSLVGEDTSGGLGTGEVSEDIKEELGTEARDGRDTGSSLADCEDELDKFGSSGAENPDASKERDENLMSTASPRMELTEKEARNTDVVGAFIPDDIPKGYTFESACSDGQGAVYVIWYKGMDSILINVSRVVPEDYATVDVDRTETYDVWQYEIPYGSTVPSEYVETFQNPVFLWEDMSLEIVKSRMKSVDDAGDTDTTRGSFSVLYTEGVLLYFNGKGTAEEIWNMLCSVGK